MMVGQASASIASNNNGDGEHHHKSELSPLLMGQVSTVSCTDENSSSSSDGEESSNDHQQPARGDDVTTGGGHASVIRTVLSLMKVCLGTGCLALPYACRQGGIVTYVVILSTLAVWNVYSVQKLIQCLHYLPDDDANNSCAASAESETEILEEDDDDDDDEEQSSSLEQSSPAHHRCFSYETGADAAEENSGNRSKASSAFDDMPPPSTAIHQHTTPPPECTSTLGKVAWHAFGQTGLESLDVMMVTLLLGVVVSYLVAVIGFLSDTFLSVGGRLGDALIVAGAIAVLSLVPDLGYLSRASLLGLVIMAATFLIIAGYGIVDASHDTDDADTETAASDLALWPVSQSGFSHMYGVCIFGYGFVPLTYNFRDSMRQPERFVSASVWALGGVTSVNALIGVGLYVLFPTVTGEILHELPATGILPTVTRLSMALVIVVTAPLLTVPLAELLEGKWQVSTAHGRTRVRFGVCLVCVVIAIVFPGFVQVLSFVGCAFVGLISLSVPPILLLRLRYLKHVVQQPIRHSSLQQEGTSKSTVAPISTATALWRTFGVDAIMAIAGLVATIGGTISILAEW